MTYADGSKEEFQYSGTATTVIAGLATTFKRERKVRIITGDHLRRMYTRDSDMISRGLNGTSATSTALTAMNTGFMRLVRVVTPGYDLALPDADPHIVALGALRYAPAGAFSVVHPAPMSEIQLGQAVDILGQADDYMKTSNIAPKIISTGDAIRSINADNATFRGKKH